MHECFARSQDAAEHIRWRRISEHDLRAHSIDSALCCLQASTHNTSITSTIRRSIHLLVSAAPNTASPSNRFYQRRYKPNGHEVKKKHNGPCVKQDTKRAYHHLANTHTIHLGSGCMMLRLLVQSVWLRALAKQEVRFPLREIKDSLREDGVRPCEPGSCSVSDLLWQETREDMKRWTY